MLCLQRMSWTSYEVRFLYNEGHRDNQRSTDVNRESLLKSARQLQSEKREAHRREVHINGFPDLDPSSKEWYERQEIERLMKNRKSPRDIK
jgi:hypothetical protein